MRVLVERTGGHALVRVLGELTARSAGSLRRSVVRALRDNGSVIADVTDLRVADDSCVRVFPDAQTAAGGWPWAKLAVGGASPAFAAAATAKGIDDRLPIRADLLDAADELDLRPRRVRQRRRFSASPMAPGEARAFVTEVCQAWELADDMAEVVRLVASELVSNAVEHAGSAASVALEIDGAALKVEVRDGSIAPPTLRQTDVTASRGRGVALVDELADSWGVRRGAKGKTVWACFELSPAVSAGPAAPSRSDRSRQ